jgi:hypothetical protein
MKQVNRVVLLDLIEEIVYSRSVRKNSAGYKYDARLQEIFLLEGAEALRQVATRHYAGFMQAHLAA